ncbi:MAG: hypothetical protein SFW08_03335 [Gemmatimonadaceae bacterium]|nr:hypothetical protein [Gemmatimonadaceae bacterium]
MTPFDDASLPDDLPDADGAPLPAEWLAVARQYHEPPMPAPVDAIEAAVRARLDARAQERTVLSWTRRPVVRATLALAATLVIGIGIGRLSRGGRVRAPGVIVAQRDSTVVESPALALAARQHLGRTEALLTAFRAQTAAGQPAADLEPWARDLLSTTRLLLDSPAARDPRERALLEELELLLAALVQASVARRSADTDLLSEQLTRRNVISRLRALSNGTTDSSPLPISE